MIIGTTCIHLFCWPFFVDHYPVNFRKKEKNKKLSAIFYHNATNKLTHLYEDFQEKKMVTISRSMELGFITCSSGCWFSYQYITVHWHLKCFWMTWADSIEIPLLTLQWQLNLALLAYKISAWGSFLDFRAKACFLSVINEIFLVSCFRVPLAQYFFIIIYLYMEYIQNSNLH